MPQPLRVSLLLCLSASLLALCFPASSAAQSPQLSLAGSFETGIFDEGAAEIASFDAATGRLFFVNADANQVVALDIDDPSSPEEVYTIAVEDQVPGGSANSVDVYEGTIAVAVEADATTDNGSVLFYNAADGAFLNEVEAGILPDHVTFNEDGSAVVTANEGEPLDDYSVDPEGSVSVVDLSGGVESASVATAGFTAFNGQKETLRNEGVRLFGGATPLTVTGFSDTDPASITVQDASAADAGQWLTLDSDDDPIPYQIASIDANTITFTDDFDGDTELNDDLGPAYLNEGSSTVAQDLEPEYVTVEGTTAYVTLQENNAVAVVDISALDNPSVTDLHALGTKDHSQMGNGLDPSTDDDGINIRTFPLQGLYQPDAITSVSVGGTTYLLTANEGDAREYNALVEEIEVGDLQLDASLPDSLQDDVNLGETATTFTEGDTDGDGAVEELFAYGARSFSIWNPADFGSGTPLVYDSGDFFEQQTATELPNHFNADNDEQPSFEGRSDNKGPEPEAVEVGVINGTPHAFVGLERIGGVMVFDLSDPADPQFVQYVNNRDFGVEFSGEDNDEPTTDEILATGDLGPESIVFIPAAESPAAIPLVAVSNEVSGSVSFFQVGTSSTIAEARSAALEDTVTTEGVVTRAFGSYVRIQDDTGALQIRQTDGPQSAAFQQAIADGTIRKGTRLRVNGRLGQFSGLLQINNEGLNSFAVTEQDVPLPEPQSVTFADITGESGEAFESELVRASGFTIEADGDSTFQSGTSYTITDGDGNESILRIQGNDETQLIGAPIPSNSVTFTGVLSQFNNFEGRDANEGYQLLPVLPSDVQANFPLQILHVSDLEGGGGGGEAVGLDEGNIGDAPRFSAVINTLHGEYPNNTLVLSSGDNYLPGPFFSAGGDGALASVLGEPGLGRADIFAMNEIGFDASALGNHEFDQGSDRLFSVAASEDAYRGTTFPYLSANLTFEDIPNEDEDLFSLFDDTSGQDPDSNSIAPSVVFTVNGRQVGLVGATTPTLKTVSSPGDDVNFTPNDAPEQAFDDLVTAVQAEVDALTDDGVDIIVVVSHLQAFANERDDLAPQLENVDLIVAGGSDRILTDGNDRLRPEDDGISPSPDAAYPTVVQNANGEDVLVVSTDGQYKYVGRLVVSFDETGSLVELEGDPIVSGEPLFTDPAESGTFATDDANVEGLTGQTIDDLVANETVDPDVLEASNTIQTVLNQKLAQTFGETDVFLDGVREDVRTQETNLGNLTAAANLAYARAVDPAVEMSIKNGGGIRAPIGSVDPETGEERPPQPIGPRGEGEISLLDIEGSLRFDNGLSILEITAADLKFALENGVSQVEDVAGRFPQIAGLRFSFDPDRQALDAELNENDEIVINQEGRRVRSAALVDSTGAISEVLVQNGTVVNPDRVVKLVTLDFLAGPGFLGGIPGDGYFSFLNAQSRVDLTEQDLPDDLLGDDGEPGITPEDDGDVGGEQDALAEYLAANFSDAPFNTAETEPSADVRIQNLNARDDRVLTPASNAFITEFHYDNAGADEGEFVEVAIVESLTDAEADSFNVVLYNGSTGEAYTSVSVGDGSRTALDGEPFDLVTLDIEGIQNGAPDGIALCRGGDVVTSGRAVFFSYEGTFTAADGCAAERESFDIGVAEGSDTEVGQSLQLTGSGVTFGRLTDASWDGPFPETPGALRDGQSLPVELAAFEGVSTDNGTALTWRTATETNNAGFAVQRRIEAQGGWTQVGFVEGAGTTSEPQSYRFTDQGLPYEADRLEYRLRQVDTDGSASYSTAVTVERRVSQVELLGTFPNPAQNQATVRYALPGRQDVTIRLYDVLGRQVRTVVRSEQSGRHEQRVDLSGLSSGVYFLRLQAEGTTKTQKLTIVR